MPSAPSGIWRRSQATPDEKAHAPAFKLRIKADAIEEYEREHTRVWPELLAKLKEAGISDYSIFRRDQDLFLRLRVDDFNRAWEALNRDPANQRWQHFMGRLFEPVPDVKPGERFAMLKRLTQSR